VAEAPRPPRPTTVALLLALAAVFAAEAIVGGDPAVESSAALLRLGALYLPAVLDGDWWRIGSYAFLHIGWLHIAFNGYALWILMPQIELTFGSNLALGFFAATALAGGSASALWSLHSGHHALAAGASGGVFGLFGATIALYLRIRRQLPEEARKRIVRTIAVNLLINLAIAFKAPVDNAAHLGGLFSGLLLGLVAPRAREPRTALHRAVQGALIGCALLIAAMEGAAVARAVKPKPRTLRGAGVEAQVPGLFVPLEPGLAGIPGAAMIGISSDREALRIEPGEDAVRIGERTWLRERTTEKGAEVTRLAASDGGGRVVIELWCGADFCRGPSGERICEQVAHTLHTTR
jgi:membrane associated rhomboid family serine protease